MDLINTKLVLSIQQVQELRWEFLLSHTNKISSHPSWIFHTSQILCVFEFSFDLEFHALFGFQEVHKMFDAFHVLVLKNKL